MEAITISVLISLGLTNAIVYELIFDWFRTLWHRIFKENKTPKLHYLISCPVCIGFWIGIIVGGMITVSVIPAVCVGFTTSFINKIVLIWQEKETTQL